MIRKTTRIALATVASCAATLGPAALAQADPGALAQAAEATSQPAGPQAAGAVGSGPLVVSRSPRSTNVRNNFALVSCYLICI